MFILIVTDFELERTKVLGKFADEDEEVAYITMETLVEEYRTKCIINDAHYTYEESCFFFHEGDNYTHCKSDCGDNIKWEIIEI